MKGLGTMLSCVLVTLKLADVIEISWFWALSPMWLVAGLWITTLMTITFLAVMFGITEKKK